MNYIISRIAVGVLSALMIIGAIAAGTAYAGSVVKKNNLIDEQTAEDFAILHAGVESDNISEIYTRLEYKHGQYEYNIKFSIDDTDYKYKIRAQDGSVISKEMEYEDTENGENVSKAADQFDQHILTDKEETDVTQAEQTDKINSETPDPAAADTPAEPAGTTAQPPSEDTPAQKRTNNHISVDQAKQTALDHAGLSENEVKFSSAKLEKNDGKYEYDIEFYKENTEYEYEIDAVTGEIIESEIDYD